MNDSVDVAVLLIAAGAALNADAGVSCHSSLLLLIRGLVWAGSLGTLLCSTLLRTTLSEWLSCSRQLVLVEFGIGTADLDTVVRAKGISSRSSQLGGT